MVTVISLTLLKFQQIHVSTHLKGGDLRQIGITAHFFLRLMLGLWLLMTVVLVNLYMSTLTSYLTVVKLKPIPNSLEDLVYNYEHKGQCLLTMQKGSHILSKFYVRITFICLIS